MSCSQLLSGVVFGLTAREVRWHTQLIFIVVYLLLTAVVFAVYARARVAPPWVSARGRGTSSRTGLLAIARETECHVYTRVESL